MSIHLYRLSWLLGMDYLAAFANRVRRLRETAGLSIQEACNRGGISVNSWGKIERGEQEPCLLVIGGISEGLGTSIQILMTLEEGPSDNSVRSQINDVLDLCRPDQCELTLRIVRAIHEQGTAPIHSSDQNSI